MEKTVTKKDFSDFLARSPDFFATCPIFIEGFNLQEYISEIIDEIQIHVNDWYEGNSYYPKPEDILMDYTQCTHLQAHKFLPAFTEHIGDFYDD